MSAVQLPAAPLLTTRAPQEPIDRVDKWAKLNDIGRSEVIRDAAQVVGTFGHEWITSEALMNVQLGDRVRLAPNIARSLMKEHAKASAQSQLAGPARDRHSRVSAYGQRDREMGRPRFYRFLADSGAKDPLGNTDPGSESRKPS